MAGKTSSHSPILSSKAKVTMTFPEAIEAVIAGERITKLEWDNADNFGMLKDNHLMIHLDDGWHQWIISDGDLLGDDWVTL